MTALALACELCGLERGPGAPERFCCAGCLNVFAILQESGMVQPGADLRDSELFRQSLELGLVSNASARKRAAIPPGTTTEERLFRVSGMWCASCAWLIQHCLLREYGVASADVFFASDLVKVRFHPQYLPPDRIVQRIESLGYKASEYRPGEESSEAAKEKRDLTLRLGVAAFLWVNVMMLNLSVFIGVFQRLPEGIRGVLPFVVMALASPVILYSARPVFRAAWIGLKNRVVRMETLLALGIAAAYGYSTMQAFTGGTHIYFDISCAIVTLVLIGKQIERGAKEKAAHAITSMYRMLPNKARAYVDGREHFISIEALKSGDQFVVKVGERMPADGIVVEGESHADESLLTGESAPVMKSAGSVVVCGSVNTSGVLRIRATTVGDESTLARILQTVERALISRSSIERIVDRVSRYFVPAVIVLSSLTFVGWRVAGGIDTGDALMRAITILVIACPCALGIATPLALTAAVGAASRHGILVGDSRVLETLRKVDTLVLDKTGTVTEADFSPVEFRQEHLQRLASLEVNSEHPLGIAVVREARRLGMPLDRATDVNVHKGLGISGSIGGTRVFAGNRRMVPAFGDALDRQAQEWESRGLTVAFYGWDAEVQGAVAFGCRIKPGTRELVDQLQQKGLRVLLVSGDSYATTAWTASQIGVDEFEAEALPDDKAKILERLRGAGNVVAMVGDGVNDAPALAQADLGIAMGSGAEIAMQAAAMVLMNSQLTNVLTAFDLAHATMRVIRQNLFWAFFYNVAGITFAVAGFLNPIMAAGAMIVSSLSVVGNSYRLSRSGNLKA